METAEGKVAVITGGARGLGLGLARWLRAAGWRVAVWDLRDDRLTSLLEDLGGGPGATVHACDVADEAQVATAVAATVAAHGRLDALVNNAGLAKAETGAPEALSREVWDRYLAVNLTGPFLCAKHAAPHLRAAGGAIVNIASVHGLATEPQCEAYAASKAGLLGLTRALAFSLGPAVRVNAVCPGWIEARRAALPGDKPPYPLRPQDHAQHPAGRVGRPEDIAALVEFLLSENAGFITGEEFVADGGMLRRLRYA